MDNCVNNALVTTRQSVPLYSNYLFPLSVLLIGAMLSYGVGRLDNERQRSSDRAEIALKLSSVGAQLEKHIRSAFSETEGIAQLLSADGFISSAHLRSMAQSAIDSVPYIFHVVLAPKEL